MFFRPPYLGSSRIDEILDEAEREGRVGDQERSIFHSSDRQASQDRTSPSAGDGRAASSQRQGDVSEESDATASGGTSVDPVRQFQADEQQQSRIRRTVRTILAEDDLIPECKAMNLRLFEYFSQPTALRSLVQFAIGCDDDEEHKYAGMATEVLCSDVERLNEAFISNVDVLELFLGFVRRKPPLAADLVSNFAKIFLCMLRAKSEELLSAVDEHKSWFFSQGILQHLQHSALSNLIIELLIQNEIVISRKAVHIYAQAELLKRLVDLFVNETESPDDETLSNVMSIIVSLSGRAVPLAEAADIFHSVGGIPDELEGGSILETAARANQQHQLRTAASGQTSICPDERDESSATAMNQERKALKSLDLLRQPELLARLLSAFRQSDAHLLYGLSMLTELVSINKELSHEYETVQHHWEQTSLRLSTANERQDADTARAPLSLPSSSLLRPSSETTAFASSAEDSDTSSTSSSELGRTPAAAHSIRSKMGEFETALQAHLPYLLSRLEDDAESGHFGVIRLKLVEFLIQMMQDVSPQLCSRLLAMGIPATLTRLLRAYPWVSVFHHLYHRALQETLLTPFQSFLQAVQPALDEANLQAIADGILIPDRLRAWFLEANIVQSFVQLQQVALNAESGRISPEDMRALVRAVPQLECTDHAARAPPSRIRVALSAHLAEMILEIYEQVCVPLSKMTATCTSGQEDAALATGAPGWQPATTKEATAGTATVVPLLQRTKRSKVPLLAFLSPLLGLDEEGGTMLAAWAALEAIATGPVYAEKSKQHRQLGGRRPSGLSSHSLSEDLAQLPTLTTDNATSMGEGDDEDGDVGMIGGVEDRQDVLEDRRRPRLQGRPPDGAVFQEDASSFVEQHDRMDPLFEDMDEDRDEYLPAPPFIDNEQQQASCGAKDAGTGPSSAPELSVDDMMTGLSEGEQESLTHFTDYLSQRARRTPANSNQSGERSQRKDARDNQEYSVTSAGALDLPTAASRSGAVERESASQPAPRNASQLNAFRQSEAPDNDWVAFADDQHESGD